MAPPVGLLIGNNPRKPTHRIGRILGTGACSIVYELERLDGVSEEKFAIKVTPLPPPRNTPSKRKKPTEVERNANLLHHETLMYKLHLTKLWGTYIPRLPPSNGPPQSGDVDGYRFLVIEKMNAPLFDVIPRLLAGKRVGRSGKIPFGNIAARLLDCVEAIHGSGYLIVDVKPENFMLAQDGKTLSEKVRAIDFALIQTVRGIYGHRDNDGTSSIVGTPLYSSLNVHDGQTHSRRDDLEALGYVVGELLIKLIAAANGRDPTKAQLPWSDGASDEDIGELKKKERTSTKSAFFDQMGAYGNIAIQRTMRDYFSSVQETGFKTTPDYPALREMLLRLDVSAPVEIKKNPATKKSIAGRKTPTHSKTTPTRQTRSSDRAKRPSPASDDDFSNDEKSPPKLRRVVAIDDDDDVKGTAAKDSYMTTGDDGDDDDDYVTAMEWQPTGSDENQAPQASGPRLGIKIYFKDGPHRGESLSLIKGQLETVYLGNKPSIHPDGEAFALDGDTGIDDTHLKIMLQASKHLQTVGVTDLKSSTGTLVQGKPIDSGKERKVFIHEKIVIGETVIEILPLAKQETPRKKTASVKRPSVVDRRKKEFVSPLPEVTVTKSALKPTGPGLSIRFTEGPHENESIVLQKGATETVILGTNPKAPKSGGETHQLKGDASIDANHVRLQLNISRNVRTVIATDLKSSSGTYVNNRRIPPGKDQKVFISDSIQIGDTVMKVDIL